MMVARRIVVPLKARNPQNSKRIMEAVENAAQISKNPPQEDKANLEPQRVELPEIVPDERAESILLRQLSSKLDVENQHLDRAKESRGIVQHDLETVKKHAVRIAEKRSLLKECLEIFCKKVAEYGGETAGNTFFTPSGIAKTCGMIYVAIKLVEALVK